MGTISKRLAKLENRRGATSGLFFTIYPGEDFAASKQAQITAAKAQRQPVLVMRLAGNRNNPMLSHS